MRKDALSKAIAFVMWADNKLDEEEWVTARGIVEKYGIAWPDAMPMIEERIEALLDESDEDVPDSEEPLDLGGLDFGDGVDRYDVLDDLALLVVADNVIEYSEIEILHCLGKAMNVAPEIVSLSLLKAAASSNGTVKMNL